MAASVTYSVVRVEQACFFTRPLGRATRNTKRPPSPPPSLLPLLPSGARPKNASEKSGRPRERNLKTGSTLPRALYQAEHRSPGSREEHERNGPPPPLRHFPVRVLNLCLL